MCPQPRGEAEAVGFDGTNRVIVQTREPAAIQIPEAGVTISLSDVSRADVGHEISTPTPATGLPAPPATWRDKRTGGPGSSHRRGAAHAAGRLRHQRTRAYHWDGGLASFGDSVTTVYNQRMGGPGLVAEQVTGTQAWMNAIPRLPGVVGDPDAVARGQAVFTDSLHGCATCHSGAQLTDNRTNLDVGTGGERSRFRRSSGWPTPPLTCMAAAPPRSRTASARAAAAILKHGFTSTLTPAQVSDLVAYLDSL